MVLGDNKFQYSINVRPLRGPSVGMLAVSTNIVPLRGLKLMAMGGRVWFGLLRRSENLSTFFMLTNLGACTSPLLILVPLPLVRR